MKSNSALELTEKSVRWASRHVPSFSRQIYGIDWSEHFPATIAEGVRLEPASLPEALAFTSAHYARIFGEHAADGRFFVDPSTPARRRFLEASDRFVFREDGAIIGLLLGNPVDWSTYYWRSVAFLPEHQGRGLLAAALERTDAVMREAGILRVEGEAAPVNYRQVRLLLRLGYCVTGSANSERWGTLLRFTKYLCAEAEERFVLQFCRDTSPAGGGSTRCG